MKSYLAILLVILLSTLGFGQGIDERLINLGGKILSSGQAAQEKAKLSKASKAYNDSQPKFKFNGATIEVRVVDDQWGYGNWGTAERWQLRQAVAQKLTARGATVTWDRREIERESDDRDAYDANRHVKKPDWLGKPTIELANYQLDLALVTFDKREDMEQGFGSWLKGVNLRFGRQSAYAGITSRITDRRGGTSNWIYKVLEVSSTADNLGGDLVDGFFGSSIRGNYDSNPEEANRMKVQEKALRALGDVYENRSLD